MTTTDATVKPIPVNIQPITAPPPYPQAANPDTQVYQQGTNAEPTVNMTQPLNPNQDCRARTTNVQPQKEVLTCHLPPSLTVEDVTRVRVSNLAQDEAKRILDVIAAQQSYDSLLADTQRQTELAAAQEYARLHPQFPPPMTTSIRCPSALQDTRPRHATAQPVVSNNP